MKTAKELLEIIIPNDDYWGDIFPKIINAMEEYAQQASQSDEPELCPICKETYLSNRVCLTCTRKLCSPINIQNQSDVISNRYNDMLLYTFSVHNIEDGEDQKDRTYLSLKTNSMDEARKKLIEIYGDIITDILFLNDSIPIEIPGFNYPFKRSLSDVDQVTDDDIIKSIPYPEPISKHQSDINIGWIRHAKWLRDKINKEHGNNNTL
jgi:ribosomal protein L32